MKRILSMALTCLMMVALAGSLTACEQVSTVYFLNAKPELDEIYQQLAEEYSDKTGTQVQVVSVSSGQYDEVLAEELYKKHAPTIFQINGPVGYVNWKDYTRDLTDSEIYTHLNDKSLAIRGKDGGVYGIPFSIEGYGIIVNKAIMEDYFLLPGARVSSLESINSFEVFREVVEDMQANKKALGIKGVFATPLDGEETWRWQAQLLNIPLHYEWENAGTDLGDLNATSTIEFTYSSNTQNLIDLYLQNATDSPKENVNKTIDDAMHEFAKGQVAMVQNGSWAYNQIYTQSINTVNEDEVAFLPIYIGMEGEESQGICIGTDNFFAINKNASANNQKASLDFLNWLYTSEEGRVHVTKDLGFIAPFDTFSDSYKPADPLARQVMEWSQRNTVESVPWSFTIFPSTEFREALGINLQQYALEEISWDELTQSVIDDWASEKAQMDSE